MDIYSEVAKRTGLTRVEVKSLCFPFFYLRSDLLENKDDNEIIDYLVNYITKEGN